LFYYFISELM